MNTGDRSSAMQHMIKSLVTAHELPNFKPIDQTKPGLFSWDKRHMFRREVREKIYAQRKRKEEEEKYDEEDALNREGIEDASIELAAHAQIRYDHKHKCKRKEKKSKCINKMRKEDKRANVKSKKKFKQRYQKTMAQLNSIG